MSAVLFASHSEPPLEPIPISQPETESPSIDPKEDRYLEGIITARRVAGDFGIAVELGQRGAGSYCVVEGNARKMVLDPEHLENSPSSAVVIPAHEGAHAAISVGPSALGISEDKIEACYSQIGFGFMHNCQEDGSVNDWLRFRYIGITKDLIEVYDPMLKVENPELGTPEIFKIAALIGGYPRFAQFGSEIMKIWYTGQPSQQLDTDVELAISRTRTFFEEAIKTIPSGDVSYKEEVLVTARKRWNLMTDYVWAEMQRLVKLDVDEQKIRKALSALFQNQTIMLPGFSGSGQLQKIFDKAIRTQAQKMQQQMQARGEVAPSLDELENYIKEQIKKSGNFPIADIPPELQRAAEEYMKTLDKEQLKNLEEQAKKALEDLEDSLNEQLQSKFNESNPPSHQEVRQAKEQTLERLKRDARDNQISKQALNQLAADRSGPEQKYENVKQIIQPKVEESYHRLRAILLPEEAPLMEVGYSSGSRVSIGRYIQAQADPDLLSQIWQRRAIPTQRTHAFKVIVDISGSMEGEKAAEAQRAAVYCSELLSKLQVPFSIDAFHSSILPMKDFDENVATSSLRHNLGMLPDIVGGGTMDANAIAKGYNDIQTQSAEHRYIIMVTDAGSSQGDDLKLLSKTIQQDGQVIMIHFGIGSNTKDLAGFYKFSFGELSTKPNNPNPEKDFFSVFSKVIESTIVEPWLFQSRGGAELRLLSPIHHLLVRSKFRELL